LGKKCQTSAQNALARPLNGCVEQNPSTSAEMGGCQIQKMTMGTEHRVPRTRNNARKEEIHAGKKKELKKEN
jgi:hypothetical protein